MRMRSRSMPSSNYFSANNSYYFHSTGFLPTGSNLRPDLDLYSYISDVDPKSVGYDRRAFHPCSQRNNIAACYKGNVSYSFNSPVPSMELGIAGKCLYTPPTLAPPLWEGIVDNLAGSLAGRTRGANMLAVSLKEIGQTIGMFRNPFNLMKPNWRKIVKRDPASTLAKKSANVWLEYLYGWKSFKSDLDSFSESCGQAVIDLQSDESYETAERYSNSKLDSGTLVPVFAGNVSTQAKWDQYTKAPVTNTNFGPNIRVSGNWKRVLRVGGLAENAGLSAASKTRKLLSRFDLSSFHALRDILWEVIPYSFVVDWFIDLHGIWALPNRWIISENISRNLGYSTKTITEYQIEVDTGIWYPTYVGYGGLWRNAWPNQSNSRVISGATGICTDYTRVEGLPSSENWQNSCFTKGLSISQLATGLSLISQRIL